MLPAFLRSLNPFPLLKKRPAGKSARRPRLTVEALEDRLAPASGASLLWLTQVPPDSSSSSNGIRVAAAGDGSIYAVGNIADSTSANNNDAYVCKFAADGTLLWSQRLATAGWDEAQNVAVDAQGNLYVVGVTTGAFPGQSNAHPGGYSTPDAYDAFVCQFEPDGTLSWLKQFGTDKNDAAFSVAADALGNVTVGGCTLGVLPGQVRSGPQDAFLCQFSSDGDLLWTRQFGCGGYTGVDGLTSDGQGNLYLVGAAYGAFPGQTWLGDVDTYVAKYTAGGGRQWVKQLGTKNFDAASALALDGLGNLYIAGQTNGTFAGATSAGDFDGFLAQVGTADGRVNWTRQFGTSGPDSLEGVAVDARGNVYFAGSTRAAFPGQSYLGMWDAFVGQYRPDGSGINWVQEFGTDKSDMVYGLAIDPAGKAVVTGTTTGSFPGEQGSLAGELFVAQLASNQAATTASLASSKPASAFGQTVTLTATVAATAGVPAGKVTFYDGTMVLGTATLDSTGHATLNYAFQSVGEHQLSALYTGSSAYSASGSASFVQVVSPATTTTALTASAITSKAFQAVTVTATVTASAGKATGTVTFKDGATVLGTAALDSNGRAALTYAFTTTGTHSLTAVYAGATNFAASTSSALTESVTPATTTTTLVSSKPSILLGEAVTLTTAVAASGGKATGTVTFKDGATVLGTAALDGDGRAALPYTFTTTGAHSLTAVYAGAASFVGSTSSAFAESVKAATSTTLTSSLPSSTFGQAVTLTVLVTADTGTVGGSVTFKDGTITIGTATLDSTGRATLSWNPSSAGAHSVSAVYAGTANFATSTSAVVAQAVSQAATATALSTSLPSAAAFQQVTFTATVTATGAKPAGTVAFKDGDTVLGTATLDSTGRATFKYAFATTGAHSITAVYAGSANFIASTSAAVSETINPAATTTALSSSQPMGLLGQQLTLTAAVAASGATPGGTVTFLDGATTIGTATLNSTGRASLTYTFTTTGAHSLTAVYAGAASLVGSTSAALAQTIRAATTTVVTSSLPSSTFGQAVTLTALVTAATGSPTGMVTFRDGATTLGTATLDGTGHASLSWTPSAAGSHSLTAAYAGDATCAGSTSAAVAQSVSRATTGTTLASPDAATVFQAVRLTATVTASGGQPAGSVTFKDGTTTIGTATVDSTGHASLSWTPSSAGAHSLSAVYAGTTNFAASTSAAVAQAVSQAATTTALSSSVASAAAFQQVTFTATVTATGAKPAGSVTFKDGATALGTATLDSTGRATFRYAFATTGAHSITVAYSGSANFLASTSPALTQTINQAATTTTLTSSQLVGLVGQQLTLTAAVAASGATPGGTVTFLDGTTTLGTATLDGTGRASLPVTFTTSGTHALTAVYAGTDTLKGSTSSALNLTVSPGSDDLPGTTVSGEVRVVSGQAILFIRGTDGSDSITLSQSGGALTLKVGATSQQFTAPAGSLFSGITVSGYGGDDRIQLDNTIGAGITATINGGGGNDSFFNNGADKVTINTGDGADVVVTVGGGAATVNGGAGVSSFWVNPADVLNNVTAAELAAKCVHRIAAFKPPAAGVTVPLTIAGQTMTEPASSVAYASFAGRPLFVNGPQPNDIIQGALGDCYFLAGLSSLAQTDTALLRQSITELGDGTYAVRFFRNGAEEYYRLDAKLPSWGGSPAYAQLTRNGGALWVPLLEKAFAEYRSSAQSYASIEGGWVSEPFSAVAGASSTNIGTGGDGASLAQRIQAALQAGNPVGATTPWNAGGPIIGSHAYSVRAVEYDTATSTWYVTVYNPWGVDGASYDSNSGDGYLRLTISVFQANFNGVCIGNI